MDPYSAATRNLRIELVKPVNDGEKPPDLGRSAEVRKRLIPRRHGINLGAFLTAPLEADPAFGSTLIPTPADTRQRRSPA